MHVLSNLDGHQHALNEYMGRELFMFFPVFKALSQISFYYYIDYNKEYVYARILFTNDQTKEAPPNSDAFLGQRLLSLVLHVRSTALNCTITTVQ